jgi:hypothetical protein
MKMLNTSFGKYVRMLIFAKPHVEMPLMIADVRDVNESLIESAWLWISHSRLLQSDQLGTSSIDPVS